MKIGKLEKKVGRKMSKKTFLKSVWNSLFKNITFIFVRPRNRKNVTPFFYDIIFVSWCLFSAFWVDSIFLENLKIDSAGDFRAKRSYIVLYQLGVILLYLRYSFHSVHFSQLLYESMFWFIFSKLSYVLILFDEG